MPSQQAITTSHHRMPSQQAITRSHHKKPSECHLKKPSQQRLHSSALKRQGGHSRNARVDELLDFALHERNWVHHALRPDDVHLWGKRRRGERLHANETGSITHSGPMTFTLPGVRRPDGHRWNAYLCPSSLKTVCPAFSPELTRATTFEGSVACDHGSSGGVIKARQGVIRGSLGGHQGVIRGSCCSSWLIRAPQVSSGLIRAHQGSAGLLTLTEGWRAIIMAHHDSSGVIRAHQGSSP